MIGRFSILPLLWSAAWAQVPDLYYFAQGAYAVFEKANCRSCHNRDGVAAGTRLLFPEAEAAPARVEAFGRSLVTLIDRLDPAKSLLLEKPTKRIAHAGGERIKPGGPDEAALRSWFDRLTKLSGDDLAKALRHRDEEEAGAVHKTPRSELRRLTHSQYNQTVRDLLGDASRPRRTLSSRRFRQRFSESNPGPKPLPDPD